MKVVVLMSVLKSFFFFLFASAACTVPVLCLWADIYLFNLDIPEISLTEIVQESVLGGIVFIHFLLAKKWAFMRYCNILIGGFFLSMLIRELDAFSIFWLTEVGYGLHCFPPFVLCFIPLSIIVLPLHNSHTIPVPRGTA